MGSGACACRSGASCRASRSPSRNPASACVVASSSDAPPATSSRQRSSRCCDSSSMISFSRDDDRRSDAKRERMCGVQSGMFASRHLSNRFNELIPSLPLSQQHTLTGGRQPIETAPALAGLLDPCALNPPALLEAVEQWIERIEVEHQPAAGLHLDQLAEFVAMPGSGLQHRQQEQFGGSLLQLAVECRQVYICHRQIITSDETRGRKGSFRNSAEEGQGQTGAGRPESSVW